MVALLAYRIERLIVAPNLAIEIFRAQQEMRRFEPVVRVELRATDGIAAGNGDAVQRK